MQEMLVKFVMFPRGLNVETDNFFDWNPEIRYFSFAKELIEKEGEDLASRIMWAIAMGWDPVGRFFREDEETKRAELATNVVGDKSFDFGKYSDLIAVYQQKCMTEEKYAYLRATELYAEMLDKPPLEAKDRVSFLKSLSAVADNIEKLKNKAIAAEVIQQKARGKQQPGAATTMKKRLLDRIQTE